MIQFQLHKPKQNIFNYIKISVSILKIFLTIQYNIIALMIKYVQQ